MDNTYLQCNLVNTKHYQGCCFVGLPKCLLRGYWFPPNTSWIELNVNSAALGSPKRLHSVLWKLRAHWKLFFIGCLLKLFVFLIYLVEASNFAADKLSSFGLQSSQNCLWHYAPDFVSCFVYRDIICLPYYRFN